MRIPRFWSNEKIETADPDGYPAVRDIWGWSFESLEAAKAKAREQAKRLAELISSGHEPARYGYGDRPIREEIRETLVSGGHEHGLITQNQYGSLVLNSSCVLFADVDFPNVIPRGFWDALRLSFSRKFRAARLRDLEQAVWNRVKSWIEANAARGFRLYRTARGLRLLMTDRLYEPKGHDTDVLFEELGSDPLYRKLTQVQECFRARLTPKPWRCGHASPPQRFPFADEAARVRHGQWEAEYAAKAKSFRACELLGQYGNVAANEAMEQTVRVHDERACYPEGAPLA